MRTSDSSLLLFIILTYINRFPRFGVPGSNASAMVTESGDDLLRMLNNSSMVTLSVSPLTACARNYGATVNR